MFWHDRLSHPNSSMMCRIIEYSQGHPLKNKKIFFSNKYSCTTCLQGKLILKSSLLKSYPSHQLLIKNTQGHICVYSPTMQNIPLFYDLNRCLYQVVTCLSPFYTKCCLLQAQCINNQITSIILKLPKSGQYVLIMLINLLLKHLLAIACQLRLILSILLLILIPLNGLVESLINISN